MISELSPLRSPFADFLSFAGKSCGGYELEDLNGNAEMSELYCKALCSSRLDCAAFEAPQKTLKGTMC